MGLNEKARWITSDGTFYYDGDGLLFEAVPRQLIVFLPAYILCFSYGTTGFGKIVDCKLEFIGKKFAKNKSSV